MNRNDLLFGGLVCAAIASAAASSGAQAFPTPAPPSTAAPATQPPPPSAAGDAPAAPPASAPAEPVDLGTLAAPPIAAPSAPPLPAPTLPCPPGSSDLGGRCVESCRAEGGRCQKERPPGFQRHDGFFVRETSGVFSTSLRAHSSDQRSDLKDQTVTANLTVDVGAAVIDNLIVRGRLEGALGGFKDSPFGPRRVLALFGMLGAGVDYYFMPINLYVGGTLGVAGITIAEVNDLDRPKDERDNRTRHSKAGLGLDLDVGKEWWVSGNWGLGLSLRFRYVDVAPANVGFGRDGRLDSFQVGLSFSATYN